MCSRLRSITARRSRRSSLPLARFLTRSPASVPFFPAFLLPTVLYLPHRTYRSTGYWTTDDDQAGRPGLPANQRGETVSPHSIVPESRSSAPFEPDIGILLSPLRSMFCDEQIVASAQAWDDIMDFGNLKRGSEARRGDHSMCLEHWAQEPLALPLIYEVMPPHNARIMSRLSASKIYTNTARQMYSCPF